MSVARMKATMAALIETHEALLELAARKREAIKIGDAEEVRAVTEREVPLVDELDRLENERQSAVREDLGPDRTDASFTEWAEAVVGEEAIAEWQKIYLELANSVYALKQANRLNQELLRDSLTWVKMNLNLLMPQEPLPNYANPKDGHSGKASAFGGRFDSLT